MSHSLNEIAAHAKRAARGAGLSWGMAEEAGRAARWLASYDLAGPALLSDVLTQNDGLPQVQVAPVSLEGDWQAPSGDLCPLAAGTALNDCADRLADGTAIVMHNVSCPLLVLPFAAWAALHLSAPVRLAWSDLRIDTDGEALWLDNSEAQITARHAAVLTCQLAPARTDAALRPKGRGTIDPETWTQLDAFAQRTFAPATKASRLLGAGAGLSDND